MLIENTLRDQTPFLRRKTVECQIDGSCWLIRGRFKIAESDPRNSHAIIFLRQKWITFMKRNLYEKCVLKVWLFSMNGFCVMHFFSSLFCAYMSCKSKQIV